MKKTKRRPVWGPPLARYRGYTLVDLAIDTWHSTQGNSEFVVVRSNLARKSDRRDANRMYCWMRRRTRMVERVRAQLAKESPT